MSLSPHPAHLAADRALPPDPASRAPVCVGTSPDGESPGEGGRVQTPEPTLERMAAAWVSVGLTHEVSFQDTVPGKRPPMRARIPRGTVRGNRAGRALSVST